MASTQPGKLVSARSFSRLDSAHAHPQTTTRSRGSTLSEVQTPDQEPSESTANAPSSSPRPGVFEKETSAEDIKTQTTNILGKSQSPDLDSLPDGFDELPIELVSLTDRFIASLTTAKIYSSPPSVEKLSELFQEFYQQAESHISTHIQILASRQFRDVSPAPSTSSKASRLNSKTSNNSLKRTESNDTGQKMLTPGEISERRKSRRLLEHKRIALEEAVERRACEGIYAKIWRHRTTLDEVSDEKLRSKTEALAVVGIGLKDLGIELPEPVREEDIFSNESLIEEYISKARQGLFTMNNSHNPLGKLQGLASTHQSIVDLLTQLHQSSSSADEILPTLIYTLIQSPAEQVNAISNLHFIQLFRSHGKINGEVAYCLTNLEAAITFLETVDLATLRDDEAVATRGGTSESSRNVEAPVVPPKATDLADTASKASPVTSKVIAKPIVASPLTTKPPIPDSKDTMSVPATSPSHQRRLSSLLQPATAIGAASGAVISTADESFRNIKYTLDSSFKLLFGRLREQNIGKPGSDSQSPIRVPKTLDEARRMVSPKAMVDEDGTLSENSSVAEFEEPLPKEDRILDMIAGSRQPRERSVDSTGSGGRKVGFASETSKQNQVTGLGVSPPVSAAAAVESMRNFGNSLNPLNRLSGIGMMRGFGRSASNTPPIPSPSAAGDTEQAKATDVKIAAPIQKFLDLADARELKLGEVEALLKDYQRLAQVLKLKGLV